MTSSEKFCLKWNDFLQNIGTSFNSLREESDFQDITLACEDGKQIEAHKVILASSSTFFNTIIRRNKHTHPLIYMKGMRTRDLVSIIDFMYHGEVNIFQEDIDSFLSVAEDLGLKGLTGTFPPEEGEETKTIQNSKTPEIIKLPKQEYKIIKESVTEIPNIDKGFVETSSSNAVALNNVDNYMVAVQKSDEIMATIESMIHKIDGLWICNACGKSLKNKQDMSRHVEGKHIEGILYPCNHCDKTLRSRDALRIHIHRGHKTD